MNYLTSSDRFYDDFSSSNEDEDQGEDEDIFYHNYSVEYASQMLNGKHRICPSSIDRRIRSDRHSERILKRPARSMKMSTWDQQILQNDLSNHSSRQNQQNLTSFIPRQERNLPSLDQLDQELQRRTQKLIQDRSSENTRQQANNISTNENSSIPLTEDQLRQVHQQQQLFQQHLVNMQRQLEQQQQQQQRNPPKQPERENPTRENDQRQILSSFSSNFSENPKREYDYDDDQQEIVHLIETDPYFAAAMEDFVRSHRLLDDSSTTDRSSSSSSSSSDVSSIDSSRRINSSNKLLLNEIREIRHLMKKYFHSKEKEKEKEKDEYRRHYPPVDTTVDEQRIPFIIKRKDPQTVRPQSTNYQNLVETMKDVLQRRSPSHKDQPLRPSQIDSKYKSKGILHRPAPLPPLSRSSSSTSIRNHRSAPPPPPPFPSTSSSIPRAPPLPPSLAVSYQNTTSRSSSRLSPTNRQLSYGNQGTSMNFYDRFLPRFSSLK